MFKNFTEKLNRETNVLIDNISDTLFFKNLRQRQLPIESYIAYLRSLATIHAFLEHHLETISEGYDEGKCPLAKQRLHLILSDLRFCNAGFGPDLLKPAQASFHLVGKMRVRLAKDSSSVMGYLYALEKQRITGKAFIPWQRSSWGSVWSYLQESSSQQQDLNKLFAEALETLNLDQEALNTVLLAAKELLVGLKQVLNLMLPLDGKRRQYLASSLNPEAGFHMITQKEDEIHIAIKVSNQIIKQLPYIIRRYGERGRYFTYSDAAWQIQLTHLPSEIVLAQLRWLAGILSPHGMPSYTLILKLKHLEKALRQNSPKEAARFEKLRCARNYFEVKQAKILSKKKTRELLTAFMSQGQPCDLGTNFFHVLTSAVMDEYFGYSGSEMALRNWLVEKSALDRNFVKNCLSVMSSVKRIAFPGSSL